MTDFSIRRATESDSAALGELGATLMRVHHDFDPRRFVPPGRNAEDGYAAFLGGQVDTPGAVVLVAEQAGQVVGYVYAGIEPHSWKELRDEAGFIHDLVVHPSARGEGIATALLEAAVAWLTDQGVPRVLLWTAALNAPAQRLFARQGFRQTMIEMTRELPPPRAPSARGRTRT